MDGWTLDESALLLSGANPRLVTAFDDDPCVYKPDFTSCGYVGFHTRLRRAADMGVLRFPASPLHVLRWAAGKHAVPLVFAYLLEPSVYNCDGTAPAVAPPDPAATAGTPSSVNAAPAAPAASAPAPSASAPAVAVPEPVAAPVEAVPVTPQGVQKRVMVKFHVACWPTIETDMKDAATNGLAAARAGARGWREAEALAWAESKGRLLSVPKPGSLDAVMRGGFTSIRHTLDS